MEHASSYFSRRRESGTIPRMLRAKDRVTPSLLLVAPLLAAASCDVSETTNPLPLPVTCDARSIADGMTSFSQSDIGVYFETGGDPGLEIARADLASYLGRVWGSSVDVAAVAPDF